MSATTYQVATYHYGWDECGQWSSIDSDVFVCRDMAGLLRLLEAFAPDQLFTVESYSMQNYAEDQEVTNLLSMTGIDLDDVSF